MKTAIEKKLSDSAYPLSRLCGDNEEVLRGMAHRWRSSVAPLFCFAHIQPTKS
jgi:hypothetical protein